MAAAGVPYKIGREANEVYGETLNGVQTSIAQGNQFVNRIDPYVIEVMRRVMSTGVSDWSPIRDSSAAIKYRYNFISFIKVEENRSPLANLIVKRRYELLLRAPNRGSRHTGSIRSIQMQVLSIIMGFQHWLFRFYYLYPDGNIWKML